MLSTSPLAGIRIKILNAIQEVGTMIEIPLEDKKKSIVTKEEWKEYTKSVWTIANVSHETHPAMFPEEIPHRLIKLFSFHGETILDPFSGVGTTGVAALSNGRKFVGVDTNDEYIQIAKKRLNEIDKRSFKLKTGNSMNMEFIEDSSIDLIICSPPYWNKADYGNCEGNVGSISNYREFLDDIKKIFSECYRVLSPGRRMCVVTANVNQNTQKGLLTFPLAADYINVCRDINFLLVNEIIWSKDKTGGKWGSYGSQRPIFGSYPYPPNFYFKNVHEYILIFKKPNGDKNKAKLPSYEDLMS